MTKLEQIEKLRERANVSYDEAKQALESADGDILEALIYLEKQGKVDPPKGGGYYSSERVRTDYEDGEDKKQVKPNCDGFMSVLEKIGKFVVDVINKGNNTSFEVIQHDITKAKIPVTVMVLLVLFLPWVIIPLLIVGLFFGFSYRFVGFDG
ncbi:MAG: DUF4342 domain-containing protein [Firmicutes bacterium]|nr:DUF4342 domain-containing protein [Bacillota bacterium]